MGTIVRNNSFSIFAGQITGIFGLVGSGRTETFKVVAGVLKRDYFHGGKIVFNDKAVRYRVPARAIAAGIVYVTEDRKVDGFFETMRSEEHTSELQSLMRISYAVFCLKKKNKYR